MLTLTPKELSSLLEKTPEKIELIDVRGTGEYDEVHVKNARLIPLPFLPLRIKEIDTSKQVIFICKSGGRSAQACSFALNSGIKAYNLTGGTTDFEKQFPNQVIHGEKKKLFGIF